MMKILARGVVEMLFENLNMVTDIGIRHPDGDMTASPCLTEHILQYAYELSMHIWAVKVNM